MSEENVCEYCKKSFSSLYNLNVHKKTTKACIDIQKKQFNLDVSEVKAYVCEDCGQSIMLKANYESHLEVCKARKSRLIDQTITTLQDQLNTKTNAYDILLSNYNLLEKTILDLQNKLHTQSITYEHIITQTKKDKNNEVMKVKIEKFTEIEKVKTERYIETKRLQTIISEKDNYIQSLLASKLMNQSSS